MIRRCMMYDNYYAEMGWIKRTLAVRYGAWSEKHREGNGLTDIKP